MEEKEKPKVVVVDEKSINESSIRITTKHFFLMLAALFSMLAVSFAFYYSEIRMPIQRFDLTNKHIEMLIENIHSEFAVYKDETKTKIKSMEDKGEKTKESLQHLKESLLSQGVLK